MLARVLIVIGVFAYLPLAQGQFMMGPQMGGPQLGNSLMGSSCPYPFQMAPNAYSPQDGQSLYQTRMDNSKKQMDSLDKRIKPLAKKVEDEESAIRKRIDGDAGEAIIDHIEGNNEPDITCNVAAPSYAPVQPPYNPPQQQYYPPPPPTQAVPEPVGEGPHSNNRKLSTNRMPAADTPNSQPATSPTPTPTPNNVVSTPVVAPPPATTPPQPQTLSGPTTTPSGGYVAPPPPDPESYDGHGPGSGQEFCQHGHNFWEEWIAGDGQVNSAACSDQVTGIQTQGTYNNGSAVDGCEKALSTLKSDYAELRDLKKQYDKQQDDYNEFQNHEDEQTTASAAPLGGGYGNGNGQQNFMAQMMGLYSMMQMSQQRGPPMIAGPPMGGPGMVRPPVGYPSSMPIPMGGWPMGPTSQYQGFNYQSPNPGLMGMNNGCYGCVTGGVGQGAYGCNGMGNSMLYGNGLGPGGFAQPYQPWQGGAPFSLPMPRPPGVLPLPTNAGYRPMVGSGAPGILPPVPYSGVGGLGYGGLGGLGYGAVGGAGILPAVGGAGYGVGGGAGYSGNGYSPGSIRPLVPGTAALGAGGLVGSGYYGAGYMPGSTVPPILQPSPVLGAGSTSVGGAPSILPTH